MAKIKEKKRFPMKGKAGFLRNNMLEMVKFWASCLLLRVKITLLASPFKMKILRSFIPLLMGLLLVAYSPHALRAQELEWPWALERGPFQVTHNSGDDFSAFVTSNTDLHLYFVVWYRTTPSGFDIYGARINMDGWVVDNGGIPICTAANDQMFPVATWDGENFFVVWQDRRNGKRWEIYGAWVTPNGEVFPQNGFQIAGGKSDQISPALSFDGVNYLVVWQTRKPQKAWNLYFSSVSKNGEVTAAKPVNPSLKDQASPSVAYNGATSLVIWQDFRDGKVWEVYGARITSDGEVLESKGIPISLNGGEASSSQKWRPIHSWNGNFYLVVWIASKEERWYLEGRRITGEGTIIDPLNIEIQADTTNKTFPALLWDNREYVLLWEEEPEGQSKIYGASILPYGPFAISDAVQISPGDAPNPSLPGISRIGDECLVVWHGMDPGGYWQIYGQLIKR